MVDAQSSICLGTQAADLLPVAITNRVVVTVQAVADGSAVGDVAIPQRAAEIRGEIHRPTEQVSK